MKTTLSSHLSFTLLAFFFALNFSQSQTPSFTWMSGDEVWNKAADGLTFGRGIYGIKGSPATENTPGLRNQSISWIDASGNYWLFGGNGNDKNGLISSLNDLWKYNPTANQWTWMGGSDVGNKAGVYGVKGQSSSNTIPGGRSGSISWQDSKGIFWLFGGTGFDQNGLRGALNDLWKYDPSSNQWTWVSGESIAQIKGAYGTKGVASTTNLPGGRSLSVGWIDINGNFWLFGGIGYDKNNLSSSLNDLWRYNPSTNQWTWISGDDVARSKGVYGTKNISSNLNIPGARWGSVSWVDKSGNFYLFGGVGFNNNGNETWLNDLWKFNINTNIWTWIGGTFDQYAKGIYGTKGSPSVDNIPGARLNPTCLVDSLQNEIWIFGGQGMDNRGGLGFLNDLWKYNIATNQWSWISGDNTISSNGYYGSLRIGNSKNLIGGRLRSVGWINSRGVINIFGGSGLDENGNSGNLNDLWKYDIPSGIWTWMGGNSQTLNIKGVYGNKGQSSTSNYPGNRLESSIWIDSKNFLWIFGGQGYDKNGLNGLLNDLWKFDPVSKSWTWVSGNDIRNQAGNYGKLGTSSVTNLPGARFGAIQWTDSIGNLWLFGGSGYDKKGTQQVYLNDLWKFDPNNNQWTWVNGRDSAISGNTYTSYGVYTTKGTPTSTNYPGSRIRASGYYQNENFYLFGGEGLGKSFAGRLNDLWKYDLKSGQWTWLSGSDSANLSGVYGIKGQTSSQNVPGSRYGSSIWMENNENLWIFGGLGNSKSTAGRLNDLWKYNLKSGQWTWVNGSDTINQKGVYGEKNKASDSNIPGSRVGSIEWVDNNNLWMLGGDGFDKNGIGSRLNDLWKFDISMNQWIWVSGSDSINQFSINGTKGNYSASNFPGALSYSSSVKKNNNSWIFGGSGFDIIGNTGYLNTLWLVSFCPTLIKPTFNTSKFSFCPGDTIKLSITNISKGDTYKWYYGNSSDSTSVTSKSFTDSLKVYVVKTDSIGCRISSDTIQLIKNPLPALPSITNVISCVGSQASALNATPATGNTLSWYGTNATGGTATITAPIPPTNTAGTFNYFVSQISASTNCESQRAKITVNINPVPSPPTISRDASNFLVANTTGITWYINSDKLADTSQRYKPSTNGLFSATTTQNGCTSQRSQGYYYLTNSIREYSTDDIFSLSPNPFSNELRLQSKLSNNIKYNVNVINASTGEQVKSFQSIQSGQSINLNNLSKGVYVLRIHSINGKIDRNIKVVKQ